ncbi:hypothetical protein B0T24DRAFT_683562 [Lasiosphaeria ovina]|uniref:Uncharacterized protein n=1 Tax=Lasiosphaeria ovina TaxID=92902 RepID=A0AAE0JV48_9PEZI|nr:hypothetical protein B0T24DRAFT_683562 [Lasiosphaeria ovina]
MSTRRQGKAVVHPKTPPLENPLAPRTDLPPYHKHLDLADPLACINAITTAITTAAAGSPTSQVPAVTNAIVTVIKDSAFFVADRSIGAAPTVVAAAIATAIANIANSSATAAFATTQVEASHQRFTMGIALSCGHLATHLPTSTYRPLCVVDIVAPTYRVLDGEIMAVVSAASALAVASAIDSAVTSVTMAVAAAADRPGGCMRATANAYAEHASRIARVFVDAVNDLTVKSC